MPSPATARVYNEHVRPALVVIVLAGCGRLDFDTHGVAIDSRGQSVTRANGVTSLNLTTLEVGDVRTRA